MELCLGCGEPKPRCKCIRRIPIGEEYLKWNRLPDADKIRYIRLYNLSTADRNTDNDSQAT